MSAVQSRPRAPLKALGFPRALFVLNYHGIEPPCWRSRIKTAVTSAVFTARGVVLFASKESDSDRSELTKQVTDAQLVKAFPLAEKFELTKLDQSRPRAPLKTLRKESFLFLNPHGIEPP